MNQTARRLVRSPADEQIWSQALIAPLAVMAIGALAAFLSPPAGAVVLLAGFVWLAGKSIPVGLTAYLVMAPVPFFFRVHAHRLFVSDFMAIILLGWVLVRVWQESPKAETLRQRIIELFLPRTYRWALLFLLVLSVLSLGVALSHSGTVIKILEYVEFFMVVVGVLRYTGNSRRAWEMYLFAIVAAASLLSLYAIGQFLVGAGPISNQIHIFHVRGDSVFGQPNPFGAYEGGLFPFVASLVALGPKDLPRRWLKVGLVIIALGVLVSYSRGAWVGDAGAVFFMGLLAYLTLGNRVLAPLTGYAVIIPVVGFAVVAEAARIDLKPFYHHLFGPAAHAAAAPKHAVGQLVAAGKAVTVHHHHHAKAAKIDVHARTLTRLFSIVGALIHPHKYYDTQQRLIIWKSAWQAFRTHMLLGVGLGNFHLYIAAHKPKHLVGGIPPMAHDLYLEWGADLGVGGFIAGLWIEWQWVVSAIRAVRARAQAADPFWFALTVGAFGTICGFVIQNWVDFFIDQGVVVPFLLALAVVSLGLAGRGRKAES